MKWLVLLAAVASLPQPDPAAMRAGGAPAVYYEVRTPAERPRGVVLVFHGGGWCGANEPEARVCGPEEDRMRDDQPDGGYTDPFAGRVVTEVERAAVANGYVTIGASYASDEAGLADVVAFYDQAAARWPDLPIFAWGQSAGGQWALILGALRPLAGIVGEAAPADFTTWKQFPDGANYVNEYLPSIFGASDDPSPNVDDYDPLPLYGPERPPVLLLTATGQRDRVVPEAVAQGFAERVPGTRVVEVAAGDHWWVHSQVDLADLLRARRAAFAFLDEQAPVSLVAVVAAVALGSSPGAVQTCNDAPPGSAFAGVGRFAEQSARIGGSVAIDVSENACAPAAPRPASVMDGLQLRVVPGPEASAMPRGTRARATLAGEDGEEIVSYSADVAGHRTDAGYALRLTAVITDGRRVVVAKDLVGEIRREDFELPPDTQAVEWSLACVASSCSSAATGDPALRGLPASLNVYGSTAVLAPS